jgi:hypothetical protein
MFFIGNLETKLDDRDEIHYAHMSKVESETK